MRVPSQMFFNLVQQFFDPCELRLMVQRSHLHKALLRAERSTAKFIRPAQCRFASPGSIFTQARAVLLFKARRRLRLASNRDLHAFIPVSRATKTSASSFPLP